MDFVALSVDRNLSIVAIFDLKDVANDTVCGDQLNGIQPGPLEGDRMFSALSLTLARPISSLDGELGMTSITLHCATKSSYARGYHSDSVRDKIRR